MSRDITANLTEELTTSEHRPIELYVVCLDDYTLYFTDHDANIEFFDLDGNPKTYTAVALSRGTVKTNIDNKIDSVVVRLDNINRAMTDYIADYEFRGRRMVILRVYENYLTSSDDYIAIFDGLMDSPAITEGAMELTVKSRLGTLSKRVPRRMYQLHCNWGFGSTECTVDKTATQITNALIVTGSTASVLMVSGDAHESLATDYYKFGSVKFTAGNNNKETRLILSSAGSFADSGVSGVKLGISYNLESDPVSDIVTVQQGCDKTPTICNDKYANKVNYGGFLNIPQLMTRR